MRKDLAPPRTWICKGPFCCMRIAGWKELPWLYSWLAKVAPLSLVYPTNHRQKLRHFAYEDFIDLKYSSDFLLLIIFEKKFHWLELLPCQFKLVCNFTTIDIHDFKNLGLNLMCFYMYLIILTLIINLKMFQLTL